MHTEKQSFDVDVELPVEMLLSDRSQWRHLANSGVGKENIDVPVSRFDFGIQTIQIFGTRYVSLNCRDVLSDLLGCFI